MEKMIDIKEQKMNGELKYGKSGVYLISVNGVVVYVGSSLNVAKRKSNHLSLLRYNKHPLKKLQKLYDKFGEETFIFTVMLQTICKRDRDKLYQMEAKTMEMFQDTILNADRVLQKNKYIRNAEESRRFREKMSKIMSGEGNPNSKLTEKDIIHILDMKKRGIKVTEIANVYDISQNYIYQIGKTRWKNVLNNYR